MDPVEEFVRLNRRSACSKTAPPCCATAFFSPARGFGRTGTKSSSAGRPAGLPEGPPARADPERPCLLGRKCRNPRHRPRNRGRCPAPRGAGLFRGRPRGDRTFDLPPPARPLATPLPGAPPRCCGPDDFTAISAASSTAACRASGSSATASSTASSRLISSRILAASSNFQVLGRLAHRRPQRVQMRRQVLPDLRLLDLGRHPRHVGVAAHIPASTSSTFFFTVCGVMPCNLL